jgi:hypothetical protein
MIDAKEKVQWVKPTLMRFGSFAELTQGATCQPPNCKAKVLGAGDDFATNIETVGLS